MSPPTPIIYVSIKKQMCAKHSGKNLRLLCSSLVLKKEDKHNYFMTYPCFIWWRFRQKLISTTSLEDFSILTHETKRGLLELNESLFIMRNNPSLNRNINLFLYTYLISSSVIFLFVTDLVSPEGNFCKYMF